MENMKKREIVVRSDNSIYGVYDYIDILQLKLEIINGEIKEQLYFRNEHGGISEINEFGNCHNYHEFKSIDLLLSQVVIAQMEKRTKKHNESNKK